MGEMSRSDLCSFERSNKISCQAKMMENHEKEQKMMRDISIKRWH